jgi:hypothetical protein
MNMQIINCEYAKSDKNMKGRRGIYINRRRVKKKI